MIVDWATYKLVTGDRFSAEADVVTALQRAQDRAEEITERLFEKIERTESLQVDETGQVWPKAYPVESVSLPTTATVGDTGQSIKTSGTTWVDALATIVPSLQVDRPRVLVTYVGGYDEVTKPPTGLVDGVCELAHRYLNPADTTTVPAGTKSIGSRGQSVSGSRMGGAASVPPELRDALRQFRHVAARLP